MRAVLDVNVLISGALSGQGPASQLLRAARDGRFELVVSELLIAELTRALGYPELRKRIQPDRAIQFIDWVREHGSVLDDPATEPPFGSRDPADDYLLALAITNRAYLVTGDQDLLVIAGDLPILTPAQFLATL